MSRIGRRALRLGILALGTVIAVYVITAATLYFEQRELIYFPTPDVPHALAEPVRLDSDGESLKIWHHPRPTGAAVLYFGGNQEDVARAVAAMRTAFPNHGILVMNYRGYGGSSGEPTEQGLFADALALYEFAQQRYSEVSVVGRGLGGSVALNLAARREIRRVVLVSPFDSMVNLVRREFGMLPVNWLLQDRYDSIAAAGEVTAPVLMLLAAEDLQIPREHSIALLGAFGRDDVEARVIGETDHQTLITSPQYLVELRDFFAW